MMDGAQEEKAMGCSGVNCPPGEPCPRRVPTAEDVRCAIESLRCARKIIGRRIVNSAGPEREAHRFISAALRRLGYPRAKVSGAKG
jgi:hypothetical protein